MKLNQKIILTYFAVVFFAFALLLPAYYIYDPMQIFHKAWGREVTFHKHMRQQAAGIINNFHNYDSVILGTSMIENTSSKEASEKLGGEFINISMPGSSYFERAIVMRSLFRQHKVKNILYSLDVDKYFGQEKAYPDYPVSEFDYLYDESRLNDFKLYANIKYLPCVLLQATRKKCVGEKITLDRPNAWFENKNFSIWFGGLDKWVSSKNNRQILASLGAISKTVEHIKRQETLSLEKADETIRSAKRYIDENILDFVKAHPGTNFILLDPPYSRPLYAIWAQYNLPKFKVYKEILRYLAEKRDEYPNLEVYSFGEEQFIDDIATYKDLTHYHYSINSWMLSAIAQKKGLLHKDNISEYLESITQKALNYDLIGLDNSIKHTLKAKAQQKSQDPMRPPIQN
ncbi:MAG TPA: hypothetical protein VIM88_07385 [Sulfurovum sp.]|uniref:hypothetical protein n=1 Tax=Sulfurovum sp. TaxID=1969726 RepID=UPI002F933437